MITADELPLDALRAAFDVGEWRRVEPLPAGKSQHWVLTTTAGRFVLRRSYRAKTPGAVRFEHELVAHLRAGGFPAPEFVPTTAGEPCAAIDGRLWRMAVFVPGEPASGDDPVHTVAVGETLARYHQLVQGFTASVPAPEAPLVPAALAERLAAVRAAQAAATGVLPDGLGDSLAFALDEGEAVRRRLDDLYEVLPVTTIHAGCRRGSALFDGERLKVVLDFDSAHHEARALDVAVGVFDFAKIYGDPGSADYKVRLDPAVAARFVGAYQNVSPLLPAEVEAIPLLLVAKRLKRALGRYARLFGGDSLSDNDLRKIALELARVQALVDGDGTLAPALSEAGVGR